MESFTKRDWVMIRDALRWFSDDQERKRATLKDQDSHAARIGAEFDAWRRRLADEIETAHDLK